MSSEPAAPERSNSSPDRKRDATERPLVKAAGPVDLVAGSFLELERLRRQRGLPDYGAGIPVEEGPDAIDDELRERMDRLKEQEG